MRHDTLGWLRSAIWAMFLLFALQSLHATTVTATVLDPNGNQYSSGTVAAVLVGPSGIVPLVGSNPVNQSSGPFNLNGAGAFSITLTDTSTITSASFQWLLTVCANSVPLGPTVTPARVCFNSNPMSITGGSTDISAALNALAPSLGPLSNANIRLANNTWTGVNHFTQVGTFDNGVVISGSSLLLAGDATSTLNLIVKVIGAGTVGKVLTTDTANVAFGICSGNCGNNSSNIIATNGIAICDFDNFHFTGNFVTVSPTAAGKCHDIGATFPASGTVMGHVGNFGAAGLDIVLLNVQR